MISKGGYIGDILRLGEQMRADCETAVGAPRPRTVTAHGWVKTRRDSKGIHFVQLNDGSSFADLQVVIDEGVIPDETLRHVTTGASVRVTGELVPSPAAGQRAELRAREIVVFG